MLEKFIDATVRRNVWKLNCFHVNVSREWIVNFPCYNKNYDKENYLRHYKVEKTMFEIIPKIYVLSAVGLSKDEIVKNLKRKYNENDINDSISFLKNNNLIEEYLGVPYKNEVIMEINPRDICYTGKESKKFYTAELYYAQAIAKIDSKTPKITPPSDPFDIPYSLYISTIPSCFKEILKSEWNVRLLSTYSLGQWIHFHIVDKFMPEMCIIENELRLSLMTPEGCQIGEDIEHKDKEIMKKKLLERLLKRIKLRGGKNIVVRGGDHIKIKYILCKEMILPLIIFPCEELPAPVCWYSLDLHSETIREKNNVWKLYAPNLADAIRKRKKEEKDDYFFIDDISEDFDDIVIDGDVRCHFPCDFKTKFIGYVSKKLKSVGAEIKFTKILKHKK